MVHHVDYRAFPNMHRLGGNRKTASAILDEYSFMGWRYLRCNVCVPSHHTKSDNPNITPRRPLCRIAALYRCYYRVGNYFQEGNDSNQVICISREDKGHRPRKRLPIQGGAHGNGDAFRHPLPRGIAKVE